MKLVSRLVFVSDVLSGQDPVVPSSLYNFLTRWTGVCEWTCVASVNLDRLEEVSKKPRSSCLFVNPQNSPPGVESLMLMVLETCCTVGECNSPLQQALDQVGSDAGITESLSRLPYLPAADIPVGAGRSVGLRRQPKGQVLRHRVLEVLIHPCGKQRPGQSPMNLNGHGFEDWRPNRTDHDSWVDVLVRPPTLPEVVRAQMGIGRLQRFGYSHKEARWLRLVCLDIQVEEPADQIRPVHRTAISVLMMAAIQDDLQLIPGRCEIFVGQCATAHSGGTIGDEGCRRRGLCRNGVAPRAGIRGRPKEVAPASLKSKLLHHLPCLHQLPQLRRVDLVGQRRGPCRSCCDQPPEEGMSGLRPMGEGGDDGANVVIRSLGIRQECAQRPFRAKLTFATVQCCEFALREGWSPCILGMYAGQPEAPIRQLQGDGNFTRIEVAVGTKDGRRNLPNEFTRVGSIPA